MRVWAPSWRAHIEVCRVGKGCLGGGSAKGWRQCSCFLVSLSGVTLQGLVDEGPGRCSWMRLQRAKFFDWELLGGGITIDRRCVRPGWTPCSRRSCMRCTSLLRWHPIVVLKEFVWVQTAT